MTAVPDTAYQFNFKVGQDLHNIYAPSAPEAVEMLKAFDELVLPKLVETAGLLAAASNATPLVVASVPTQPQAPAQYQAPVDQAAQAQPQYQPQAEATHLCDHNLPMKLIPAGVSRATNKPYKAFYVCPQPRGMQCDKKVTT